MTELAPLRLRRPSDLRRELRSARRAMETGDDERVEYPPAFATTDADRAALLVLLHLSSLTPRRLGQLARRLRTGAACLEAVKAGEGASPADVARARSLDPADAGDRVTACGARFVPVGDPEYPPDLLDLHDPPAGLFVRGHSPAEPFHRVAVVGARRCSAAGRDVAREIGAALAASGVCVVSGGARGIDGEAHEGALRGGGPTIAVLGCGIDRLYPTENRELLERIAEAGTLVSEYPPGTPAEPFRFPARNRIIAGIGSAVVVVEGATGSGSMITAEHALETGREVFAVPGAVSSALAEVPLELMREGARMIRGADDLLEDLGWQPVPSTGSRGSSGAVLSPNEEAIWRALGSAMTPDQLAALTGSSLPTVVSALAGLELRRLVREVGGRYERRSRTTAP